MARLLKGMMRIAAWTVAVLLVVFLLYQASIYVRVWWWEDHNPASTSFMDDRLDVLHAWRRSKERPHNAAPLRKQR